MNVLIACEESQRVAIEFRKLGHNAFSCDIKDCSGGHPEFHIKDDVLKIINDHWDLVIAHPPCTYLANVGRCLLYSHGKYNLERYFKGISAREFFYKMLNCNAKRICVENPIPMKIFNLPKYDQIINPYDFGDPYKKRTCLWLKNLPPLLPTEKYHIYDSISWHDSFSDSVNRSKTFPGIAKAFAYTWGY